MFYSQVVFFQVFVVVSCKTKVLSRILSSSWRCGELSISSLIFIFLIDQPRGGSQEVTCSELSVHCWAAVIICCWRGKKNQRTARKFKSIQQPQKPWDYNNMWSPACDHNSCKTTRQLVDSSLSGRPRLQWCKQLKTWSGELSIEINQCWYKAGNMFVSDVTF